MTTMPSDFDPELRRQFSERVANTRVLITGGTGSFGGTLLNYLLKRTDVAEVRVFSRDEQKHALLRRQIEDPRLHCILGDVRDIRRIEAAMRGVAFVFHAAAIKHVHLTEEHPMEAIKTNLLGTHNVLTAAAASGVDLLVSLSTDKAVEPVNVMGMTKALHERVVCSFREAELRRSVVRYGNVLASNGSVVPYYRQLLEAGATRLPLTDRRMTRFVLTLAQSIELVMHAFVEGGRGETFVSDLPSLSMLDLASVMAEAAGREITIEEIGVRPGEKLHETLISAEEMRRASCVGRFWTIRPYAGAEELLKIEGEPVPLSSDTARRLGKEELRELLSLCDCLPRGIAAE